MPKKLPSPAEMKAAIEAFKKQFTPGFYHGSPSNKIKAFDPKKGSLSGVKEEEKIVPNVTFVTPKPEFAESFLPEGLDTSYRTGSTIYPVSVNLGKHFDPHTPEGSETIRQYLLDKYKKEADTYGFEDAISQKHEHYMDKLTDPVNNWKLLENPEILKHLQSSGHDTFSVTEGGVKNVGVFEPHNIRGKFAKFNPEDAADPDFMKAAGGSIIKGAKKALEHARTVPFVHYSNKADLVALDPNMYGTGIKGAEAARLKSAPDIRPRSYIYTDRPDVRPEAGLGSHKYSGVAEDMYPLHEDPAGFSAIAKTKAIDPYMMQFGREVIDQPTHLNELERLIKEAGYKGYANDDVGLLFHPIEVKKVEGMATGGSVFNPQGEDYDYQTALAYGMGPTGTDNNQGHWGSVAPTSDDERMLHGLPEDSYVVLKGKSHPTFHKAEAAEAERGSEIVKKGDRYYSIPKK